VRAFLPGHGRETTHARNGVWCGDVPFGISLHQMVAAVVCLVLDLINLTIRRKKRKSQYPNQNNQNAPIIPFDFVDPAIIMVPMKIKIFHQ
jgi:hypothetical protein